MTAKNQNMEMWSGDDKTIRITVTDPGTGQVVNISAATAIKYVIVSSAGAVVVTKGLGTGIVLVGGGTGGQFDVTLAAADTASLTGIHTHEAQLTLGGLVSTVMVGTLTINTDYAT